jgi:hypothetical protein
MQHLHLEYKDGTVEHVVFTRATWEQFYGDPSIQSQWTHLPNDCHHPAARLWAQLRREGYPQTEATHVLADKEDPNWEGDRSGKIQVVSRIPDRYSVTWPPTSRLTSHELHLLSHLGIEDARMLWLPESRPIATTKVNKVGQFLLF